MNEHLDPEQFNTVLQQIERIMTEPPSVELMAAWERISELEAALQECEGHFDNCADVKDGNYGQPEANAEMVMLGIVQRALCEKVRS